LSVSSTRPVGVHYEGDLRRALLDAAAVTIAELGIDGLSLRAVARRLGVSHAAPAHHFGDRTGLLTAVAVEGFERFVAAMAGVVAAATGAPEATLLAMARGYADFAERHAGYFEAMFRPGMIDTDDPAYLAASSAAFDALRAVVADCQNAGWHVGDDTRTLAAAAWSLAHGIAVLRGQRSLGRHFPDDSLAGVATIAGMLVTQPGRPT